MVGGWAWGSPFFIWFGRLLASFCLVPVRGWCGDHGSGHWGLTIHPQACPCFIPNKPCKWKLIPLLSHALRIHRGNGIRRRQPRAVPYFRVKPPTRLWAITGLAVLQGHASYRKRYSPPAAVKSPSAFATHSDVAGCIKHLPPLDDLPNEEIVHR